MSNSHAVEKFYSCYIPDRFLATDGRFLLPQRI